MRQDGKKRFALNRMYILVALTVCFLGWISGAMLVDGATEVGVVGVIITLITVAAMILMPWGYRFDQMGVTICYVFLPNDRYLWSKIWAIEIGYQGKGPRCFRLMGKCEGKERFYTEGQLCKNRRTKRLLESYGDGTITGYFFEDFRKRWRSRKAKQEKQLRQLRNDEIVLAERTVREETRSALALLDARAAQLGISMKIKFCYMGENEEESNSRPKGNYTYTAQVSLSPCEKTDSHKRIDVSSDLLYVRMGKTAYRSVKDEDALPALQEALRELMDELQKGMADPEIWEQLG